jgi:hypothetical protein
MTTETLNRLQYLCDTIPSLLLKIQEGDFTNKPEPGKWSKKEILGHLIDSATNNHQRFVRAQFENVPVISYDQNNWNACSRHNQVDSKQLISFWVAYNKQLIALVKYIPNHILTKECNTGGEKNYTIQWLLDDYVQHTEYHLKQIVEYK